MSETEALYIGNATRQMVDFQYRIDINAPVRSQPIPPGSQVKLSGELRAAQVNYILEKHAKYGLVAADEIDRTRGFFGTCYSVGKPISGMRLTLLMDRNLDALIVRGQEIREQSAVAQNNLLETALIENNRPERLTGFELTVQQENRDADNNVAQFSEGFKVRRDAAPTAPTRGRGGRRKAA